MRVLVFGFSGELVGGIETYLLNLSRHMSSYCVFDYVIPGESCMCEDVIRACGGEIFYVPSPRKSVRKYIAGIAKVVKQRRRFGSLAYCNLFSMANPLPAWFCRLFGYRVVLHAHNNGLQTKNRLHVFLHRLGKMLLSCNAYIRWSNSLLSAAFMFGEGKQVEIIYNAVDVNRFRFDEAGRAQVRKAFNAKQKVIGFVGRLEEPKNPVFMLRVFADMLKLDNSLVLWIVGEGSRREDMEREAETLAIQHAIRWLGQQDDIPALMSGMDLLLLPSLFEGLGIVLIEAQASGLRCLTSEGVVPDMVQKTPFIRFASLSESPQTWAQSAMALLDERLGDRSLGACLIAQSFFDIEKEARRVEKMMNVLVNGAKT